MISIIIPTVGRLEKLKLVLDRLLVCRNFQLFFPEVVVVFDGKRTEEFLAFQGKNAWVSFYETGKKRGASRARNLGLDKSRGEVISFIGDDTIPTEDWLQAVESFHSNHPEIDAACLGKVSWVPELAGDPFHQWLENNAQFGFSSFKCRDVALQRPFCIKALNSWKYFYTSNISLKRSFIGKERFSEDFTVWGFEDTEFGYRLSKKGMKIFFNPNCEVLHDHPQTLEGMVRNTRNSRKNAELFEQLHPEVRLLPEHRKRFGVRVSVLLKGALWFSWPVGFFSEKIKWWRMWKGAWIGE